jgi:hypothetical protein
MQASGLRWEWGGRRSLGAARYRAGAKIRRGTATPNRELRSRRPRSSPPYIPRISFVSFRVSAATKAKSPRRIRARVDPRRSTRTPRNIEGSRQNGYDSDHTARGLVPNSPRRVSKREKTPRGQEGGSAVVIPHDADRLSAPADPGESPRGLLCRSRSAGGSPMLEGGWREEDPAGAPRSGMNQRLEARCSGERSNVSSSG